MSATERFLRYAKIHTTSDEVSGTTPSSPCQWDLAKVLVKELKDLGLEEPKVDENCVVTAFIPASPGHETAPAIGFLAHMDTSPSFSGENVEPVLHENYDGGDVALPKEGRVLRVSDFPFLPALAGKTLITASGSTLLGADDKAGIAEIVEMCAQLMAGDIPHGRICVAFTPDEEIGQGPDHFDVAAFGAKYAYTVDGGAAGSIEYENFNAASAVISIQGVSVHPGSAKGVMENALLIAQEINALLPAGEIPSKTEGYEGFFHLDGLKGTAAAAQMGYIIRDHNREKFEARKAQMQAACAAAAAAHPTAKIALDMKDSYYNMREKIEPCMHLVGNAKKAAEMTGVEPTVEPIRGGTDGARLSFMGLPCPNLGTGGFNFHGPAECVCAEDMETVVEILLNIVKLYSA